MKVNSIDGPDDLEIVVERALPNGRDCAITGDGCSPLRFAAAPAPDGAGGLVHGRSWWWPLDLELVTTAKLSGLHMAIMAEIQSRAKQDG